MKAIQARVSVAGDFPDLMMTSAQVRALHGAGMEVGFTPHWSAKVEYLYMDLGSRTYALTGTDLDLRASVLRFGVNYRF